MTGNDKQIMYFNSEINSLNNSNMIIKFISDIITSFENEIVKVKRRSDLILDNIVKLDIKIDKSKAIVGGSYI